jgi:hypothetical protein
MPPLVGFQTGQCCRGHFRKPRVETLTEIHRQPYSITRPLRRALMSAWGQTEKNSVRAYVFRFALQTRTLLDAFGMSQRCQQRKCAATPGQPLTRKSTSTNWPDHLIRR